MNSVTRHHRGEPVAVAILAKAPVPGLAKTQLAPVLGPEGAAALQARFIERTVATALAAAIGPVTLWAAPDCGHPLFQALATKPGMALAAQPDGDIGGRMLAALAAANGPAIAIGTDCPALDPADLRTAAAALADGIDVVILPAADGGYGLIGMRRPQPALLTGMIWSTPDVMAQTRARLARLGLTWREPARLWDVDVPADLARLAGAGLAGLLP